MADAANTGRFVWYDLVTTDPNAAKDFYPYVVGWTTTAWDGPTPYDVWTAGDTQIGGIMDLQPEDRDAGDRPHWIGYIAVPDTDEAVDRATDLGARILADPQNIPKVGRYAVLADPQGAVFAVFTPVGSERSGSRALDAGDVSWHELTTNDRDAAWNFYHRLFGWTLDKPVDMGGGDLYHVFNAGDRQVGGMFAQPDSSTGPAAWLYYIRVPDLDAALDRVRERGGRVLNGPTKGLGGDRVARCADPQGAIFALHAPND